MRWSGRFHRVIEPLGRRQLRHQEHFGVGWDEIKKRSYSNGEALLKAFLARSTHPEGTLTLGELRGFLFALNAAPELVKPSGWILFILYDE